MANFINSEDRRRETLQRLAARNRSNSAQTTNNPAGNTAGNNSRMATLQRLAARNKQGRDKVSYHQKKQERINTILQEAQKYASTIQKKLDGMNWSNAGQVKQEIDADSSRMLKDYDEVKQYVDTYGDQMDATAKKSLEDALKWMDDLRVNAQSAAGSRAEKISSFGSEDAWFKGAAENRTQRQQRYADNQEQIKALRAARQELITCAITRNGQTEGNDQYSRMRQLTQQYGSLDDINEKIKQIRKENRDYERGEDGWTAKELDDNYEKIVAKQQREQGYQQKYAGKTYSQINQILAGMADGDEKEWLKTYAPTTMTVKDYDAEISAVDQEISALQAQKQAWINAANSWSGQVGDDPVYRQMQQMTAKYGSMSDIDSAIEQAKAKKYELENGKKYNFLEENEDFNALSKADLETYSGNEDYLYRYINDKNVQNIEAAQAMRSGSAYANSGYDKMTEDEIAVFNYLYHTQGKDAANDYLSTIKNDLSERRQHANAQTWADVAEDYKFLADAVSVAGTLMGGIGYIDVLGQQIGKKAKEAVTGEYAGPIDYNGVAMTPTITASTIRGTRAQNLADEYGVIDMDPEKHPYLSRWLNGKSMGDVYQLRMSMVDSTAVALLSPVVGTAGTLMLSGNAATQTMLDAVANGATDEQALTMGAVSGAFEYLFEKYELEGLLKNGSKNAARAFVAQALSEGFGEGATTVANMVADTLIMAENSQLSRAIAAYMENNRGMSEKDATKKAIMDMAIQTAWDFAGGVVTGGIMGGRYSVLKKAGNALQNWRQMERTVEDAGPYTAKDSNIMSAVNDVFTKNTAEGNFNSVKEKLNVSDLIQKYKSSKVNKSVLQLVDRVKNGVFSANDKVELNPVSAGVAARIKELTGVDASGFHVAIEARQIEHILKDHGENGASDHSMANPDDIAKIEYALEDPDAINSAGTTRAYVTMKNGKMKPADTVIYEKQNGDGSYYVVQAVPDTKKKTLYVVTAFIGKSGYKNMEAPQSTNANSPGATPAADSAVASNNNIIQPVAGVNGEVVTDEVESAEGKVLRVSSGENAQVVKFANFKKGKATVEMSNGAVVAADDISFSNEEDQLVFQTIAGIDGMTATAANTIWQSYKRSGAQIGASKFARAAAATYRAGYLGNTSALNTNTDATALPKDYREMIFTEGRKAAQETANAEQTNVDAVYAQAKDALSQKNAHRKNTGRVRYDSKILAVDLSETQSASVQLAQLISPAVSVDIVVYDGGKEWGCYDPSTDEIRLNVNAKWNRASMMAYTLGHELVHRAKKGSPAKFKAFADFLVQEYGKQGASVDAMILEQIEAAQEHGIRMTEDEAFEEVVADACQKMLLDTDAGKKLAQFGAESKQNRSFLEQLKTWINELLDKLRSLFKNVDPDSMAAREFAEFEESTKQILADMFVDMSIDAGEKLSTIRDGEMLKNTTAEGGVKSKIVAPFTDNNGVQYDSAVLLDTEFFDGLSPRNWGSKLRDFVKFRAVSEPFILPIFDENGIVQQLEFAKLSDRVKKTNRADHSVLGELSSGTDNLSKLAVIHIDEIIDISEEDVPYYSAQDQTDNHGWLDKKGWLHRVAHIIDARKGTIYRLTVDIARADDGRHIMYATKGKINRVGSANVGSLKFRGPKQNSNSAISLAQQDPEVKRKDLEYLYAVNDGDLEKAQNLVDQAAREAGYTVKAYHGTTNREEKDAWNPTTRSWDTEYRKITVFKRQYPEQVGHFFNSDIDNAGGYGYDLYSVYLMLKKPLVIDCKGQNYASIIHDGKEMDTYEWAVFAKKQRFDGVVFENISDGVGLDDLSNLTTDYVVFDSNRIKSADPVTYDNDGNVIPLSKRFNPKERDIRYKLSTNAKSDRQVLVDAFEQLVSNSKEYEVLQDYKKHMDHLLSLEEKLERLSEELKKLTFSEGPKDWEYINNLRLQQKKTINQINYYDNQLLNLEKAKVLRDLLERKRLQTKQRSYQKAKEYYREKSEKRESEIRQYYRESRRKAVERHDQAQVRQQIRKDVQRLDGLLNRGTKEKNVKLELKEFAGAALRLARGSFLKDYNEYDMIRSGVSATLSRDQKAVFERCQELLQELDKIRDEKNAEPGPDSMHQKWDPEEVLRRDDREEALKKELAKNMKILRDANIFRLEHELIEDGNADQLMDELMAAYKLLQDSDQEHVRNVFSEAVYGQMDKVKTFLAGKAIKDMNAAELTELRKMYKMVLHTITHSNDLFAQKRKADVKTLGEEVIAQLQTEGKTMTPEILDRLEKMGWANLKPETALEVIGSDTLTEMMQGLYRGEDTYARDIEDARKFADEQGKKYGRKNWDMEKTISFAGTKITLGQAMSLYAYTKRKQAQGHLEGDGFTNSANVRIKEPVGKLPVKLAYIMNATKTHTVNKVMYDKVAQLLTPEQKKYADAMQEYLSKVMGAKGNEVSMQMYGIKLFEETAYFPLKTAQEYHDEALGATTGEVKLKNSGFTKKVQEKASNPIVLDSFESVWAAHVDKMSLYHGFVLPMEDFDRVYNYHRSTEVEATNAWGESFTKEVDSNETVKVDIQNKAGKAANDYIENFMKQLNGGVRGDATEKMFGSLVRNFKKTAVLGSLSVAVQQPTAFVRAMAYLDLKDIADYKNFLGKEGKPADGLIKEMYKYAPVALMKHIGGFDPGLGRTTEGYIFEEKSGVKGALDKYLGMFPEKMDEWTWTYIWLCTKRQIHRQYPELKIGSESYLQKVGERFSKIIRDTQVYDSVLTKSQIMRSKNVFLQMATSFMNEPTTSMDMYIRSALQAKRGKISKKQVARNYAAVVGSQIMAAAVVSFVYALRDDDEDETYWEKYVSAMIGKTWENVMPWYSIPFVKDIFSIFEGYSVERSDMSIITDIYQGWQKLGSSNASTWEKTEAFAGSILNLFGIPLKNVSRDIRGIWNTVDIWFNKGIRGTGAGMWYAALEGLTGKKASKEDQLLNAVTKNDAAHIMRVLATYSSEESAFSAFRSAVKAAYLQEKVSEEKAMDYLQTYAGHDESDAQEYINKWQCELDTGMKYDDIRNAFVSGEITEKQAQEMYVNYGGYSAEEAADKVEILQFRKRYPESELTDASVPKFLQFAEPAGISLSVYTQYVADKSGKTKKDEILAVIQKLPISRKQKDVLYLANGYAESKLDEAPWN